MPHARYIAIGLYTNSPNFFAKSFSKSISPNIIAAKYSRYMVCKIISHNKDIETYSDIKGTSSFLFYLTDFHGTNDWAKGSILYLYVRSLTLPVWVNVLSNVAMLMACVYVHYTNTTHSPSPFYCFIQSYANEDELQDIQYS